MNNNIALNAGIRSTLLSLKNVSEIQKQNTLMLSTSLKVNSALDNPSNYYTASSLQDRYHDLGALLNDMMQSVQILKNTSSTLSSVNKTISKISSLTQSALTDIPTSNWINPDPPLTDEYLLSLDGVGAVARTSEDLLRIIDSGVTGKIIITDHLEFTDTILNLKEGQELVGIGTYAADNTNAIESDGRKASLTFNFTDGTTVASTTGIVMAGKNAVSDMAIKVNLADKKGVTAAINASAGGDNRVGNVEITINDTDVTGNVSGYGVYVGKNSDVTVYGKGSVVYTAEEPSTKAYNFVVADTAELNFEKDSSWIVVSPLTNATGIDIAVGAKVNVDDARLIINNLGTSGRGINAAGDLNINGESKIEIDTGNVGISGTRNINIGGASVVDIASSGVAFSLGAAANLNISDNADIDIKTNNIGISNGNVTVSGKATLDVDAIGRGMEGGSFESRDDAQIKIDTKVEGFYNTNILTGGNSSVEVSANSYGVYLDGKTANFADNSKITINSTSHAFYATNSAEISFGGNVTADITTKNANADVFKLLNGAVLNFNDKANVRANAKGNAADIIDLTANSVVNFGSNSKLVGTGAYYENALVSILNDSTDSAINFAKGAQVGFYNEVQDINRLWMVNENLSFVDTGKTYNLSVEHLTDFTIVADAVNEVDNSKPTPTTTITKEWLESQADVGVVVTNIDELKAAIASSTQKLIVIYGQIDINNDKIALKSGQKLVGVSYFADRNAAAADVDGNRFSKLNFNYSYNAQHADNAITLANDTLLSGLEINYSHNYASNNSNAIYMNKASGVEISDIDLNVTDSRTDASINLNGIYASGSEYSLAGDVNIKLNNDGLSSTGLRGIYNYSSTSAYYGGDLNLSIDAQNNTAIYNYVYVNMEVNDDAKITTTGNINSTHGCKLIFTGNSEFTTLGYSGISNSVSDKNYPGTTTEVSGNAKITTGRLSIGGANNDVRAQLDIKDNAQIYITSEYQDGDSFSVGNYVDASVSGTAKIEIADSPLTYNSNYYSMSVGSYSVFDVSENASIKMESSRQRGLSMTNALVSFRDQATLDIDVYGVGIIANGNFNENYDNHLKFLDDAKVTVNSRSNSGLSIGTSGSGATPLSDTSFTMDGNASLEVTSASSAIYFGSTQVNIAGNSKLDIDSVKGHGINFYGSEATIGGDATIDINSDYNGVHTIYLTGAASKPNVLTIQDNATINAQTGNYNNDIFSVQTYSNLVLKDNVTINAESSYNNAYLFETHTSALSDAVSIGAGVNINYYNQYSGVNNQWTVTNDIVVGAKQQVQNLADSGSVDDAGEYKNITKEEAPTSIGVSKEWLESQDDVAAVVTTADELKTALATNPSGLIVVYGQIDMAQDDTIVLQEGQQLVGVGYFANRNAAAAEAETNKFSAITFNFAKTGHLTAITTADNSVISDLTLNYNSENSVHSNYVIANKGGTLTLNNLDVVFGDTRYNDTDIAIYATGSTAVTTILGDLNIRSDEVSGSGSVYGIWAAAGSVYNINNSDVNINLDGANARGIYNDSSLININGASDIDINSQGTNALGIATIKTGSVNVNDTSKIKIDSYSYAISHDGDGTFNINDNVEIDITSKSRGISNTAIMNIGGNTKINVVANSYSIYNNDTMTISGQAQLDLHSLYDLTFYNVNAALDVSGDAYLKIESDTSTGFQNTSNSDTVSSNVYIKDNAAIEITSLGYGFNIGGSKENGSVTFGDNTKLDIKTKDTAINLEASGVLNLNGNTKVDLDLERNGRAGINTAGTVNINNSASVDIDNAQKGICVVGDGAELNVNNSSTINIATDQRSSYGIQSDLYGKVNLNTAGKINIDLNNQNSYVFYINRGGEVVVGSSSNLYSETEYYNSGFVNIINDGNENTFTVGKNAIMSYYNKDQKVNSKWTAINDSSVTENGVLNNLVPSSNVNYSIIGKAISNNTVDNSEPTAGVSKEWLLNQDDVAYVVTNAEELQEALASKTEGLIVVYGQIEMKLNDVITVNENQKLVGIGYFANRNAAAADVGTNKFSGITFTNLNTSKNAITMKNNTLLADLDLSYSSNTNYALVRIGASSSVVIEDTNLAYGDNRATDSRLGIVHIDGANSNLDLKGTVNISSTAENIGTSLSAIYASSGSTVNIDSNDKLNINMQSLSAYGIFMTGSGNVNIKDSADIDIKSSVSAIYLYQGHSGELNISGDSNIDIESNSYTIYQANSNSKVNISGNTIIDSISTNGIYANQGGEWNVSGNTKINLTTQNAGLSAVSHMTNTNYPDLVMNFTDNVELNIYNSNSATSGLSVTDKATVSFDGNTKLNIETLGASTQAINIGNTATLNLGGASQTNIITYTKASHVVEMAASNSTFNLKDTASLKARVYDAGSRLYYTGNTTNATINLEAGTKVEFKNPTTINAIWNIDEHISEILNKNSYTDDLGSLDGSDYVGEWEEEEIETDQDIFVDNRDLSQIKLVMKICNDLANSVADMLTANIYNGVNILDNDDLKVTFNNTTGSNLTIKGTNLVEESKEIRDIYWEKPMDAINYLAELKNFAENIASSNSVYSTDFSIVQNRQQFTENIMNILEEGANKLVSVDMNEIAAQELALECRQMLALNALHLTTVACRGILKLW